jgi:hypothetical protein
MRLSMMKRLLHVLSAIVLAGATSTTASADTRPVTGTVAKACGLSATQVQVSVTRTPQNGIVATISPSTVTAFCNDGAGGTLSLSSTKMRLSTNQNTTTDYTVFLSGWGSGSMSYLTSNSSATTRSVSGTTTSSNLTISCGTSTPNCLVSSQINNNQTFTATVSIGLSANP